MTQSASTNAAPEMPYRYLGKTGLKISAFSYGGWLTTSNKVVDDTYRLMKRAYDAGVNFFDTAEAYAAGESEIVMGKAIARMMKNDNVERSNIVVSTKIFWGGSGVNQRGLSRKHVIEGVKASLARLGLEYVDVVFAHRPDADTPIEETVRAFSWVIDQGMAFYWGTSEWSAAQIVQAKLYAEKYGLHAPVVEQPQYNLFHRDRVEVEYDPVYKDFGLGTTVWSPLASGLLTGKYNNGIPEGSRLSGDTAMIKRIRASVESEEGRAKIEKVKKLTAIATELGCSMGQLALAWCAHNKNVSTVILGATKVEQLEENIGAIAVLPKLKPEIIERIEAIAENKPALPMNYRDY